MQRFSLRVRESIFVWLAIVLIAFLYFIPASASAALSVSATVGSGQESILVDSGENYYVNWSISGSDWSTTCYEEYGDENGTVEGGYQIAASGSSEGPSGRIGFYRFYCDSWGDQGTQHAEDTVYISEKVYLLADGQTSLTIPPGGSYTLSWSTQNQRNTACTMSYTYSGGSGSYGISPNTSGSGGSGLVGSYTLTCTGSAGQPVSSTVTIAQYATPTCSVSVDNNPIAYGGSTTLRWSSSDASTFYLNNVGYVTPNTSGAATVGPLATTNYDGTAVGPGGSVQCARTLTVNAPANCTFNGSTVNHGSSVTAWQASTVPYGSSCVSESRTCSNGTLTGSYAYSSCTVNPQPVSCSLSVNPTSVTQGQSSTLSWSSVGATSCTGTNFTTGGATSGSTSVSPSQSTTYTASCTGAGGTAQCTGSGEGGVGAPLTVSCIPATTYSCSGSSTIVQTATTSACAVTVTNPYATCTTPTFCSSGSATCLYSTITGSISALPWFVPSGDATTISWSTQNAVSCTVSGNGNTWSGTSGSQLSNPITDYTTYTLSCDDGDQDTTEDDFTDSVSIFQVPSWFEI